MDSHIQGTIKLMKANNQKSRRFANKYDLDSDYNDFDLDESTNDGNLRILYSKDENLMIIELNVKEETFTHFYLVPDSDTLKGKKGGKAGMLILTYGDKYWREIQEAQPVSITWGDKIAEKVMEIKKGNKI